MSAEAKLHAARKELLDLGLRNPLLNYRTYKARGLEIVDEKPAALHTLLVQKHTHMAFLERPGTNPATAEALPQPTEETAEQDTYTDDNLQTPYDSAALQKRLLHTYHTAHTYLEEHGVNILYVALGMLHWYENDSSNKRRRAPLVLIPVQLDRLTAAEKFRVAYTFEEVSFNLSLEAKLRIDYGLQLPPLPAEEAFDLNRYFDEVEALVADQPRWSVDRDAAVVAFFSFTKLLMFNDLDPARWPKGHSPAEHPVIQSLLSDEGFLEPPVSSTDDVPIDQRINVHDSHLVMDADSSQALAILDVNDGRNLVIQGPPGTGKSQTITNLIAEAVGNGKTVLFVSEKMAALNVVKRRLDGLGLGDGALELHSHKATKGSVMAELGRTMALGQPKNDGDFKERFDLRRTTRRLNDYAAALNTPIRESKITPYEAYGRVIQLNQTLDGVALPEDSKLIMFSWSAEEYAQYRQHVQEMQAHLGRMGTPRQHPFYGSSSNQHQPDSDRLIREMAGSAADAFTQLRHHTAELVRQFGLAEPQTVTDIAQIITLGQRLTAAPNLFALDIDNGDWYAHAPQITAALDAGSRIAELQQRYEDQLIPAAWTQDVFAIRQPIAVHGERVFKFLSRDYRQAKNRLLGLCRAGLPDDPAEQLALVDAILEVQEHHPTVKTYEGLLAELFGARWNGIENTKWYDLLDAGYWTIRLHKEINEEGFPAGILRYLGQGFDVTKREALEAVLGDAAAALQQYQTYWRDLRRLIMIVEQERPLDEQAQLLRRYAHEAARFGEWATYQQLTHKHAELALLWPAIENWGGVSQHLVTFFEVQYYQQLIDITLKSTPILDSFEGQTQETAVELFQTLDSEFLRHNRYRLAHEHWQKIPQYATGGQVGLLQNEAGKSRNHMPIRQLITAAGPAIQRLKPIFMMSPLSVAMFLPPGLVEFDLVVFDEASQVRPVDAFGAIVRGRQVVVVGDSRQLPPTSFFDRVLTSGGEEEGTEGREELEGAEEWVTESNESILDLFVSKNAPQRMLRWHYRSRHESLIAISNREFYHNQLILFPSPDATRREVGLKLRYLPDTVYDRGGTRTNMLEAQAVAAAVIEHARTRPKLTLGVAAFSTAQREAIENELEKLRRENTETEPFFDAHTAEPFFVKNLENVQGDERDVIFISIGYGRDGAGKVNLNFGPLNPVGGERRLNVLITRSRRRCEVFTNIKAEDIDLRRTESHGIAALKAYLAYAESGKLEDLAPAIPHETAAFEQVIVDKLAQAGYSVDQNVGNNGVVIDLAVRDPREPERYLVGILCDGDSYGRALYARDRDRIQPNVLNGLGWHIQRVWSTSWVNGADAAAEKLIKAVNQIADEQYTAELAPRIVPKVERYAAKKPKSRKAQLYKPSSLRVDLYNRKNWDPGEHVGKLVSRLHYQFDPSEQQFINKTKIYNFGRPNERPQSLNKIRRQRIPNPDYTGTIYARLTYHMNTGIFTMSTDWAVFSHYPQRYFAYFDHQENSFYTRPRNDERGNRTHKAVPVSRELAEAVRLEAKWVGEIVLAEGPIHQDELERRLAAAGGQGRRTALMEDFVKTAGRFGVELGRLQQKGAFWWHVNTKRPEVRDRSKLPSVSRKLEYVSDEEIAEAVRLTVQDAIAIEAGEIIPAVRRLLGFGSLGTANKKRILNIVADLLTQRELTVYGEGVTLPETSGRQADSAFITKVRQAVVLEEKKKAEPNIAHVKAGLPTFVPYQSGKTFPTPYRFTFNGEDEDEQRIQINWSSTRERVLVCQRWFAYEPQSRQFVNKIAGKIDGRLYEDFPQGERLRGQKRWYGRLRYDLVEGVFLHDGYLTMFANNWVRSDDQYRMWRDPEDGALLGRRADDKKVRGIWFSHGNVRYAPDTEAVEDIKSRSCRSLDDAVAVDRQFAEYMGKMEQGKLLEIIREEGPVHHKVVEGRLAAGSQTDKENPSEWATANPTIRSFVARVSQDLVAAGLIRIVGDFYWPVEMTRPVVRSRVGAHRKLKTTEYIPPEELCEAILAIVRERPVTTVKELPNLVGIALVGKKKLGKKEAEPVTAALQWLISHSYVKQEDTLLMVVNEAMIDWQAVQEQATAEVVVAAVEEAVETSTAMFEEIMVRPYARTTAQFEPYKIDGWTHMEAGQFSSQHYYERDPQSGRFIMTDRVRDRVVMADFDQYRHTHKKLVFDGRHGTFYEHGGGRPLAMVDTKIEQAVKTEILTVVAQIVDEEGPIHYEELSRSLTHAAGRSTRSNIMVMMAEWAAKELLAQKQIEREGAFFWPLEEARPLVVRNRSELPKVSQDWVVVAPAEIAQALVGLAASDEQTRSNAPTAVASLLGLTRPRGEALDLIKALIDDLIEAGHMREERGVLQQEPLENHILTLREVARLAELTEAEGDAPTGEVPNLYLESRPKYDPYKRLGWEQVADAILESRHYYLFDAKNELFVLDDRLTKADLFWSRTVEDGFKRETAGWRSKIYVKLRYDLRTDDFSHGNALWLATMDKLYEAYCDGDLSDEGRVYVRTVAAKEGVCDRVYDVQTGALEPLERPFVIADVPEFCNAWVHRTLGKAFHEPEHEAVRHVVFYERPVHVDEVARRLVQAAALTDQRIAQTAVQAAIAHGAVIKREKFLWPVGVLPDIKVRVRSVLPSEARLIRYVADEELAEGILQLLAPQNVLDRLEVQKELISLFDIAPLTSLEAYRVEKLLKRMVTAGLLQQAAEDKLIVAEAERFRGRDGLPTAVVAPEVRRGVRPYKRASLKIEQMLDREGWYSHVTTELWSRDYYRFEIDKWRFVFERILADQVDQFQNLPYADQIPETGRVYAQLRYDLVADEFSARPYMFYLKTERRNYRVNIDLGRKQFYIEVTPPKGGDREQRGYHFINPDSGETEAVSIREINLGMVDTKLLTEVESLIEKQMRQPDVERVEQIIQAEQPLHEEVLAWRFAAAASLSAENRVAAQLVANTVAYLARRYELRVQDGVVTQRDWDDSVVVRSRAGLPEREQVLRLVPAVELEAAVLVVLAHGSYVRFDDVFKRVAKVLGVQSSGKADRDLVVRVFEQLLDAGKVARFGNFWVVEMGSKQ